MGSKMTLTNYMGRGATGPRSMSSSKMILPSELYLSERGCVVRPYIGAFWESVRLWTGV